MSDTYLSKIYYDIWYFVYEDNFSLVYSSSGSGRHGVHDGMNTVAPISNTRPTANRQDKVLDYSTHSSYSLN